MTDIQPLNNQRVSLSQDTEVGDTTFQTVGKLKRTSDDTGDIGKTFTAFVGDTEELVYFDQTAEPTLIEDRSAQGKENIYEYTGEKFDIDSDDKSIPPTLATNSFGKVHKIGDDIKIVISSQYFEDLKTEFKSNTTSVTKNSGEALAVNDQVSLHTDGKYYKYDSATRPDWRGTAGTLTSGADESFTLLLPGFVVPGFVGLTQGADVFTDDGGTTVQVSTATSTFIGYADSATEVRLQSSAPPDSQLSQAQVEDETDTGFGTVSPQRMHQADGMLGEVRSFAVSITGALSVATLRGFGWAVCDGSTPASQGVATPTITASTPNLVDKFLTGDATASGATGGAATVTLTEAQLPAHKHTLNGQSTLTPDNTFTGGSSFASKLAAENLYRAAAGNATNGAYVNDTGSGDSHENLPPFYEVVFMIKVR